MAQDSISWYFEWMARLGLKPAPVVIPEPEAAGWTEFHDRRKFAAQAHGPEREWKVKGRPLSIVTGVCLHQTACLMGERPQRYDSTGAHFIVTRAGKVIWLHDFGRQVAAANGWSRGTISIEVDGLYAGVEGDISTVWDDPSTKHREQPMELTPVAAAALEALIRWIHERHPLKVLVAHRQSSQTRRNDPGSAIWAIAVKLHAELGLSDGGPKFKLGLGYPIPEVWDARCTGVKY